MNSRIALVAAPALGPGRPGDDQLTDVAVAAPGPEAGANAYPDSTFTLSALTCSSVMSFTNVSTTAPTLSLSGRWRLLPLTGVAAAARVS